MVTRVRAFHDWKKPLGAVFSVLLMEFGDFAMMRRMLLGDQGTRRVSAALTLPPARPVGSMRVGAVVRIIHRKSR